VVDPEQSFTEERSAADRETPAGLRQRLRQLREIYEGVYVAPYRSVIHRELLRQRDLFLLVAFADLLGVPNPVTFYTLELYPELIEQFHEWHLRLGMPQSPEGGFRCC
jgi:hypothetical protein